MADERASWYCGTVRAEPRVIGNRVVTYVYVAVLGCGRLNRPSATRCMGCGKKREGKAAA